MKRNLLRILSSLFFASALIVTLAACGDKDPNPEYFPPRADKRVYFIYMASDNNLYGYAINNIDDIVKTATKRNIGKGRIFVFYDRPGLPTQLLEFKAGADGRGERKVLWEAPASSGDNGDLNTALPSTFADALDLMVQYATAGGQVVDSYILDMWSHGDAWEQHSRAVAPRSVGNDGNYFLELEDFVDCLDPGLFDAVVFAQCYSASIEMLYLLSEKADLVLGSAPEMPAYGMPYAKVLPYIFAPVFDYKGIVDAYCGFYDNMTLFEYNGQGHFWRNSGTMAAFDCSAFTPEFVTTMQNIYDTQAYHETLTALSNASNSSSGGQIGVQSYNYRDNNNMSVFKYFDVGDFVNNITGLDAGLKSEFWGHMNRIVAYKRTGGRVFYNAYPIDRNKFTGMSTYIMLDNDYYTLVNGKYARTLWYQRVFN